jgi:3-methyladenine DNA glycosylase AlkD
MGELKSAGTAQNRKVYGRHGVAGKMYGVSYADLGKLKKKIKVDQELAEKLWASGNHDARVLASMVADPATVKSSTLDAWSRDLVDYPLTDAFSSLVARSPFAQTKMKRWTKSSQEFVGQAGWNILCGLAMKGEELPDSFFEPYLEAIESRIGKAKNRTRYAMNNALIAIGIRSSKLEKKALAAAKRIGKVEVDHGETSCKTPDAADYIRRVKARKRKRGPQRINA